MNLIATQMKKIVQKEPFAEKILISPNYSTGRRLLESCVKQGLNILNLRITTLLNLSEQSCQHDLLKNNRSVIPTTLVNEVFISLLKRLAENSSLSYFTSLEITPGVSRVIYRAILDLKMAGVTVKDLSTSKMIHPAKDKDIKLIWDEYEKELGIRRFVDQADLFRLAMGQPCYSRPCTYIVLSNIKMSYLEREFLRALTKDNFEVIDFGKPKGLTSPQCTLESEFITAESMAEGPFNKLLWLYDIANAPESIDLRADMFRSYGETNELRQVLSRIKKRGISFDQASIYYSTQEPYSHLCLTLTQELKIPVTFGQGINIRSTNPGRLYFGLLGWAEEGFKVSDLVSLILNGNLKIADKNAPSKSNIVRFFRTSGIGWGYKRYFSVIESELAQIESEFTPVGTFEDSETHDYKQQKHHNIRWLKRFVTELFNSLPQANVDGSLSYGALAGWLYDLVDGFASVVNEADGEAKKVICDELKLLKDSFTESIESEGVYARLNAFMEGRRVNSSNPKPGCLHIDHYSAVPYIARPHVFMVGLDANRFPGSVIQDPILLDEERTKLGNGLPLLTLKAKEKTYELVQSLLSVPETLTVSYSAYDTVENRMVFPAAILLQLHRLLASDERLDYNDLINSLSERKGFVPQEIDDVVGEASWWLSMLADGTRHLGQNTLNSIYPPLYDGLQAESKRREPGITPYDGQVEVDRSEVDPTVNHDIIMSCSRLEMLGKCPFAYFLRYLLNINPIEELTFDPGVWLDPMTKGELYHSIFEQFYKDLTSKGEIPELAKHENQLYEIADELIGEKKVLVPPPSDLVFDQERSVILDSCRIFLKAEEEESQNSSPKYFELTFGMPGDHGDLGSADAVPIQLTKDKEFLLRGRIDRVDETPEGLRVLDYKSGSTYGYSEKEHFKGGRQLQHGLYPLALEKLLSEKGLHLNPRVIESGYIFPTVKGEGKRILRQQIRRESLYEILEHLFCLLAQGTFVMTDSADDCNICDYTSACNRAFRSQESLDKMMIDMFRRLRNYA